MPVWYPGDGNLRSRSHRCAVGSGIPCCVDSPRRSYRSDLSGSCWVLIEPVLSAWRAQRVGFGITTPRHDLRAIVQAVLYANRTGIALELRPHDFPLYKTAD